MADATDLEKVSKFLRETYLDLSVFKFTLLYNIIR